jgi:hypothetical protein
MYAGLEFSTRRVHQKTIDKVLPPISTSSAEHKIGLAQYHKVCIDVYKPTFTENDYNVWVVAFEDADGNEFHRQDASPDEIQRILSVSYEQDKFSHIWRTFYSDKQPVKWIVWPHSESKGWMERVTGEFGRYGDNEK